MIECNVCGWAGHAFQPLGNDQNVFCPRCGSHERHRAIAYYLQTVRVLKRTGHALEIGNGLPRAFQLYLKNRGWRYLSLDMWPTFGDILGDVSNLPFQRQSFDLVVSIHVLEHVADDFRALSEIFRVTKQAGQVLIQVPYDDGRFDTVENDIPPSDYYGSGYYYSHKRDYALDIIERLEYFATYVTEIHPLLVISNHEARKHGFDRNFGTFFLCSNSEQNSYYPGKLERDLLPLKRKWLIERRAYEIFLTRRRHGGSMSDWLQAELEINGLPEREIETLNVFALLKRGECT